MLRHLLKRDQPAENGRGADDHHDDGAGDEGVDHQARQVADVEIAVDDDRDEEPVDHGDGGGLGGRDPAAEDAAEDQDRHEQRGGGADEGRATVRRAWWCGRRDRSRWICRRGSRRP